ncbi:adenylate/guanylate cyclase domain-containing protein [bacterium]|nr:adenylate/guanylate cyclase domain-containing protein [bacterium]
MITKYYLYFLIYPLIILIMGILSSGKILETSIRIGIIYFGFNIFLSLFYILNLKKYINDNRKLDVGRFIVKNLSLLSALSFMLSSIVYIILYFQMFKISLSWELCIRLANRYTILGSIATYFFIDYYSIELKRYLFNKKGIEFSPQNISLWKKWIIMYSIVFFSPLLEIFFLVSPYVNVKNGEVFKQMYMMGSLLIVMIFLFVFIFAKSVQKPVTFLKDSFKMISSGRYEKIPIISNDEMGILMFHFNKMSQSLKEGANLKTTLGKFITNEIADEIVSQGIKLKGTSRFVTVLFTDIENYTHITEHMEPEEVVNMLNDYFSNVVSIIQKNYGIVNKFIGDAVMAIFNAPFDDSEHAYHAVNSGIEISQIDYKYNGITLKTRVGINSDTVLVGNIGSSSRVEYTVIGDGVNVASRLEQLNKKYSTSILVGENTYQMVSSCFEFRSIGEELLKGRTSAISVYTID